jgi:hypothetical protein
MIVLIIILKNYNFWFEDYCHFLFNIFFSQLMIESRKYIFLMKPYKISLYKLCLFRITKLFTENCIFLLIHEIILVFREYLSNVSLK